MNHSQEILRQYKEAKQLDLLAYDIQNATQVLALKTCVERLFNLVSHLIFAVTDGCQAPAATPSAPVSVAPRAPAPTPALPPTVQYPPGYHVTPAYQNHLVSPPDQPSPPVITQPVNLAPASPDTPDITPSDKLNVVITPGGIKVIPPVGQPVVLPPQTPVDAAGLFAPPSPPPAPPGVMSVVLPRGGVMPTEVAQAVGAPQQSAPVIDVENK